MAAILPLASSTSSPEEVIDSGEASLFLLNVKEFPVTAPTAPCGTFELPKAWRTKVRAIGGRIAVVVAPSAVVVLSGTASRVVESVGSVVGALVATAGVVTPATVVMAAGVVVEDVWTGSIRAAVEDVGAGATVLDVIGTLVSWFVVVVGTMIGSLLAVEVISSWPVVAMVTGPLTLELVTPSVLLVIAVVVSAAFLVVVTLMVVAVFLVVVFLVVVLLVVVFLIVGFGQSLL
jgi:hypothetical protein